MRLNNFETALTSDCSSSDTTIQVSDTGNLDIGDYLTFEDNNEIVKITSVGSGTLTVQRAIGGTTASAHSTGTKLQMRVTAQHLDDIDNKIINHEGRTDNPHQVKLEQDSSPKLAGDLISNGHIVVDSDSAISNSVINKFIVSAKAFRVISFDSYVMVDNAIAGSGSIGQNLGFAKVRTGATANSYARQNFNTPAGMALYSGDFFAWYIYTGALSGDTIGFVGLSNTLLTTQTNHTLTDYNAGLFYDNGTFYTSSANGTAQVLTDVTGLISSQGWLKVYYDGSNIYFYWNDTLIATHSIDQRVLGYQQIWASNKANALDVYIQAYSFFRRGLV